MMASRGVQPKSVRNIGQGAGGVERSLIYIYMARPRARGRVRARPPGFNFTMVFPSKILTIDYNSKILLAITVVKFMVS